MAIRGLTPRSPSRASSSTAPSSGRSSPRNSTRTPRPLRRGERATLQGARTHPGRFEPAHPEPRPPERRRRRLLSATTRGKLYVVSKSGGRRGERRFYFAHEYDHALQDQNSTIFKDFDGVLDQSDQLLARQAIYEGDASLLMTQWAAPTSPRPSCSSCSPPAPTQPPSRSWRDAGHPARHAHLSRTRPALGLRPGHPEPGRLGRVNDLFEDAGLDRADPPPRQVRAGEAPVAVTLPAGPRDQAREGLDGPARGHLRRAPARDLAARGGLPARRRRRPRPQDGVAIASPSSRARRGLGARHADRLGHGSRRRRIRDRRDHGAREVPAGRPGPSRESAARPAGCSSARTPRPSSKVAAATGLAG